MGKVDQILAKAKKQIDFNKLCREYEKLDPDLRNMMIVEKAAHILKEFRATSEHAAVIDPANALTAIMVNATAVGGVFKSERMRKVSPYLDRVLGGDREFNVIRMTYLTTEQGPAHLSQYVADILKIVHTRSRALEIEILSLCILIMSSDGNISLKEKNYLKKMFGYLQL